MYAMVFFKRAAEQELQKKQWYCSLRSPYSLQCYSFSISPIRLQCLHDLIELNCTLPGHQYATCQLLQPFIDLHLQWPCLQPPNAKCRSVLHLLMMFTVQYIQYLENWTVHTCSSRSRSNRLLQCTVCIIYWITYLNTAGLMKSASAYAYGHLQFIRLACPLPTCIAPLPTELSCIVCLHPQANAYPHCMHCSYSRTCNHDQKIYMESVLSLNPYSWCFTWLWPLRLDFN